VSELSVSGGVIKGQPPALLRLAFRGFFLFGALFAVAAVARWGLVVSGIGFEMGVINPVFWHAHEMLFGFGLAVVAGFLLTAVQNWSGIPGVSGAPLLLLLFVWAAARAVFWLQISANVWVYILPDIVFLTLTAFFLARPIVLKKLYRNLMFVPILMLFAGLHAASVYAVFDLQFEWVSQLLRATLCVIVLLISIVGGRVVPFFTARRLGCAPVQERPWQVALANIPLLFIVLVFALGWQQAVFARLLMALVALAQAIRFFRWWRSGLLAEPLLWSLYVAYAALPVAFVVMAACGFESPEGRQALHLLAISVVAGMILAMMSRVSLGHSGRPLVAPKLMSWAFAALCISGLLRFLLPAYWPAQALLAYQLSALFFVAAFVGFIICYWPVLTRRRSDGKPG